MNNEKSEDHQLLTRTSPGAIVPKSLPPEALFILNLGPYLTEDSQAQVGINERKRSVQLYALAEKLEEIADHLEQVRIEQIVGTDPDPDDEELLEEVWEYLNGVLTKLFTEISNKVEALEVSVNEAK
jgi:hypothetical protein